MQEVGPGCSRGSKLISRDREALQENISKAGSCFSAVTTLESPCSCPSLSKSSKIYNIFSPRAATLYTCVFNVSMVAGLQDNAASSLSSH